MDPAVLGTRLASSALSPLVKQLLTREGPGAGLVDKPVRLSGLVTFRGEKRTLGEKEVGHLAARLVREAVQSPGEPPFPADEQEAVTAALARRLLALGDLDMDDVQAVRLGHRQLARALREAAPRPASPPTPSTSSTRSPSGPACTSCTSSPSAPRSWPAPWSSRAAPSPS